MISKEQIAHDLTIVYLNNRYGIDVEGYISISDGDGHGDVSTEKFPDISETNYKKVGTGERGFLGIEKKVKVEDGYKADSIINDMIEEYYQVFSRILSRLD
ncbi:MAG: hypothetical protein E7633_00540 [Ruminococcaceae bacterium]|nr:hypothetical protein [Oscillospiraceae bacterium]